jgi:signal transduction histidine kinase
MPIIQKMVLTLLTVGLFPAFLAGGVFYWNSQASLQGQVQSQLESIATIQQNRTENAIEQNRELLGSFTSRSSLVKFIDRYNHQRSKTDFATLQQVLTETKGGAQSFRAISVLSPAGEVLGSTRTERVGQNEAEEGYFKTGRTGDDVSSHIFRDGLGNPAVYLVGPLKVSGQIIGVVVIESDAQNLVASTRDYTGLGQTGETLLVKNDGRGHDIYLAPLRHDHDATLQQVASQSGMTSPVTLALAEQEGIWPDATNYQGHAVLASTRYIKSAGWGLVVEIDRAEAYQPLNQLADLLLLMLFIISVLIVFVAFYLARSLNEPILALAAVADKIRAGDLSQRAHIRMKDEIGQLAGTFNAMAAQIQKVDQMKSEFVLLTSHQLRTPATAVKGFVSMILDDYAGPVSPKQKKLLEAAYVENERQISVINSILDVARLDAGEMVLERSMVDVREVLDVCARGQAPILKEKAQTLKVIKPKVPVVLWADPEKLQMVVDNFVHNAGKYSPEKTKITLELEAGAKHITIRVSDHGIGIAQKDISRLFKRFSRISGPGTANVQGAGLGLYLADKLVHMHGGKISVQSEVGKGTTFTIELPNITAKETA